MWNSTATSATQANVSTSTNDPKEQQFQQEVEDEEEEEEELMQESGGQFHGEYYESDTSNDTGTESLTWISWFCTLSGHEYFAEVAEDFIEDDFNLTGLSSMVPFYKEALEMILDVESEEETLKVPDVSIVETSAELLYGLIHQRYIITRQGLQQMLDKYESGHFGCCPRVYCQSCSVIPCGRTDTPGLETVKLFCPNCLDLYSPPSSRFNNVDGAFFGTTFPHLLFQQYPDLLPNTPTKVYEPKIFGFKVNEKSRSGPRMQWLRMRPGAMENDVEGQDQSEGGGGNDDGGEDDEPLLGPGGGENNGSPGTTRRTEYNPPALDMELGLGSSKGGTKQDLNEEMDKQEKPLTLESSSAQEIGHLHEVSFGMSPLTKLIPLSSPTVVTTPAQSSISITTNEFLPTEPPSLSSPSLSSSSSSLQTWMERLSNVGHVNQPLDSNAKVDFGKNKNETLQTVFSGKECEECEERSGVNVNVDGEDAGLVGIELTNVKGVRRDFFDKWTGANINSSMVDSTDTLTTQTEATVNEV